MKTKLLPLAACAAAALLAPALAVAQALPVKTVEYRSESVGRTLKYNVVLPAKYEQTADRYPVLYLLHGYSGNYTHWARMGVPDGTLLTFSNVPDAKRLQPTLHDVQPNDWVVVSGAG